MALDEPKNTDKVYEIDGFQFLVDNEFLERVKPIHVDFTPYGFRVSGNIQLTSACGSCSTDGSCCST